MTAVRRDGTPRQRFGSRPSPPLVLAAHGTRSGAGRDRICALRARIAELLPGRRVLLGHVDVEEPTVEAALALATADLEPDLDAPAVIVPLFLTAGFHVRTDIETATASFPHTTVTSWLGALDVIRELHLCAVNALPLPSVQGEAPVALVAAGSSDACARTEVAALADTLTSISGHPVTAAFLAGPGPAAADVIPTAAGVLTHLLAPGHFARRVEELTQPRGIPASQPLLVTEAGLSLIGEAIAALVIAAEIGDQT